MAKRQSNTRYDREVLLKAATLYYIDGLTQEQLSKRFSTSRPTIVRMLKQARDDGLVEIKITATLSSKTILESDIESRFSHRHLRQVIVAPSSGDAKESVAKHAADHLQKIVKPDCVLGIGWSSTLTFVPEFLDSGRVSPMRIVQLGGFVDGVGNASAQAISINMGRILGAPVETIPAPVLVSDKSIRDALLEEPTVKSTNKWVSKCNIGLVGIGKASPDSPLVTAEYLSIADLNEVVAQGAVGDILSHYYDIDGNEIYPTWRERMISVDLDQLIGIDNLVAVAAGADKAESILGALRCGLVNTLIIDETLAQRLLEIVAVPD